MKISKCILLLSVICLVGCKSTKETISYDSESIASPKGTQSFTTDWDNIASQYKFPDWFVDGKFGIFIHWGVFSVPAYGTEWYARNMYQKDSNEWKHHREVWGDHTKFGYKDFIPLFKMENYDPDEWAELFRLSGAKYVVPVAEHHDGFAMYDSEVNEWNAVKMGPKKDVTGMLKKAVEKKGLKFGISYHRAENAWFFNGGMAFPSDVQDTTITLYGQRKPDQQYTDEIGHKWLRNIKEIVVKYQPELVWFDWTVNNPVLMPYVNKFFAFYYNCAKDWKREVTVNTKQGYPTDIHTWDMERGKSDKMMQFPWQTDTSVGKRSWSYIDGEDNKNPGQIVRDLVDIVSKNGNLLLNIGPKADGTITNEQKEVLLSIGKWLNVNGDAIYGTRCWKRFGEGSTETTKGSFSDNADTQYTSQDMRFTTKGNDFYAIVLNWPENDVIIHSLTPSVIGDAKIKKVELLGADGTLKWEQQADGLKVTFPKNRPCDYAYSIKISFSKKVGENLKSEASNTVMKHGA